MLLSPWKVSFNHLCAGWFDRVLVRFDDVYRDPLLLLCAARFRVNVPGTQRHSGRTLTYSSPPIFILSLLSDGKDNFLTSEWRQVQKDNDPDIDIRVIKNRILLFERGTDNNIPYVSYRGISR